MTTQKTNKVSVPKLVRIAGELHDIFKRGTADVIQIGRLLRSAKNEIGHGEFLPWLQKEFSLSEKSAQRYMAAHKFMTTVAAPLLKSDKLSDLRVRPSALYELVELHSNGQVTEADIDAVLKEASKTWVGSKRLSEIIDCCRLVKTARTDNDNALPDQLASEPTADEASDTTTSAEATGNSTDAVRDGAPDHASETAPDTAPKPKSAPSAKDHANLMGFTGNVLNLKRLATGSARQYVATAAPIADLETVADFVRAVVDLKKKQSAERSTSAKTTVEAPKAQCAEAKAA